MAAALFREFLSRQGYDPADWRVDSAGTWTPGGLPAAPLAVAAMAKRGIDLTGHASKEINADLILSHDLILVMEETHKEALHAEFPRWKDRIFTLGEMAGTPIDVDDPILGGADEVEKTIAFLEQLIGEGYPRITSLLGIEPGPPAAV